MVNLFGYIDPASTALIWQILAGIFISLGVVLGVFWRKVTTFFKSVWVKLFRKKKGKDGEENVVDESALEIEEDSEVSSEEDKSENKEESKEETKEEIVKETNETEKAEESKDEVNAEEVKPNNKTKKTKSNSKK